VRAEIAEFSELGRAGPTKERGGENQEKGRMQSEVGVEGWSARSSHCGHRGSTDVARCGAREEPADGRGVSGSSNSTLAASKAGRANGEAKSGKNKT
jgi:hypothetical protein